MEDEEGVLPVEEEEDDELFVILLLLEEDEGLLGVEVGEGVLPPIPPQDPFPVTDVDMEGVVVVVLWGEEKGCPPYP